MTSSQKTRSLASISNGRRVLAPLLLHPTSAVHRFHPCTQIFSDWDTFNLKPNAENDTATGVAELGSSRSKRPVPSNVTPPTTPTKKSKQPQNAPDDTAALEREEFTRIIKELKEVAAENQKAHNAEASNLQSRIHEMHDAQNLMVAEIRTATEALETQADLLAVSE